jgi:RHS repeat-associated protein
VVKPGKTNCRLIGNNWVYFDDFKVTVTPTKIIQSNEYYPFGMQTAQSWTRDSNSNNFLYDAGSELNSTSGFYDLPFRNYDAALGRFFQVDAMATSSHTLTPYHYAGNNPIGSNDPTGLYKQDWTNAFQEVSGNGGQMRDSYYDSWFSDKIEMWNDPFEAYLERHPERQMEYDASKVRNGSMRPEDYGKKWGTKYSSLEAAEASLGYIGINASDYLAMIRGIGTFYKINIEQARRNRGIPQL